MKTKYFISAVMLGASLVACDDVLEPAIENNLDITAIHENPSMAQGLLGNAYVLLPYPSQPETDLATDDAVANDPSDSYYMMSTGSWSSTNNPVSRWRNCYHAIQYANLLLEHSDYVQWAQTEPLRTLYNDHFKGDALAIRGMFHFYLLQAHAGFVNGQLMGVPYHTASEDKYSDFNQPRLTFKETMAMIDADFDEALKLLPDHFGSIKSEEAVPDKYKKMGATMSEYNRAFGDNHKGKVDGTIVKTIRAQMKLMAASPAFAESGVTTDEAAKAFAEILNAEVNGLSGMDAKGHTWFANWDEIKNLKSDQNPAEVLWRSGNAEDNDIESKNYPPSINGNGYVNPSQNLVDAFPMANGYPILDANSGYDPTKPYDNRDPRLAAAVLYNGEKQGVGNTVINTTPASSTIDGLNKEYKKSTVTGYYLKKLTRQDINLNPNNTTKGKRYNPRIRFTELYLDYAEMANEAYGPTADGGNGMSAYDVIKAIRKRALGIDNDPYLESIKSDKDAMRQLIRNERRLELCFENKRFWDLRRWKVDLSELSPVVKGVKISGSTYEPFTVSTLKYADYMYYGPIPYSEIQKFDALEQNLGW